MPPASHRFRTIARDKTTTERGYGADHQRLRQELDPVVQTGTVCCWRCGQTIEPGPWHLGHDDHDRAIVRGPEHVQCNLDAAAREGYRRSRGAAAVERIRSRDW